MACNLSKLECDELEFERPAADAGQAAHGQETETILATALIGLVALVLAWRLLASRFFRRPTSPNSGRHRVHAGPPLSPAAQPPRWGARPRHFVVPTPSSKAASPPGILPRSNTPTPGSAVASSPRFKGMGGLDPGLQFVRSPTPDHLSPRPPSALLARLAALGGRLRRSASPLWFLGASTTSPQAQQGGQAGSRPSPGSARYGLGLGEVESADEDSEDDETARQLRALQQSPEFHRFLRVRGLTNLEVAQSERKLRVYRTLRELDPAGFALLSRTGAACTYETQDASRWLLVLEYILSLMGNLVAAAALYCALTSSLGLSTAAWLAVGWWLTGAAWLRGRSSGGRLLGLWYEELQWGHGASPARIAAANLLELLYVCCTLGLGAVVSLGLRCRAGTRGQSVGEMCTRVRQVREVAVPLQAEG